MHLPRPPRLTLRAPKTVTAGSKVAVTGPLPIEDDEPRRPVVPPLSL